MTGRARNRSTAGFALIVVVWFLVLIGAMGIYIITNGRAETAIARNIRAAASAEALADAAIARVAFNQTDPKLATRWKLNGAEYLFATAGGEISVRLRDEAQKINPNLASEALLAALLEVRGVDRASARRLGAALADWVSPQGPARNGGAKLDEYKAAGRSYGPPNAPMQTLDDLGLVLGMTPAIVATVRPYLTIYTQKAAPEEQNASLVIRRAMALAANASSNRLAAPAGTTPGDPPVAPAQGTTPDANSPGAAANPGAPQANAVAKPPRSGGNERVIAAQVTARSRDGGVFVRYAVLRLDTDKLAGYAVLDWQRGTLDEPHDGGSSD